MPETASGRRPWLTLSTTQTVQPLGSLFLAVPSVLAPAVAPTLGFGADRVGLVIGLAYLAAMLSGLFAAVPCAMTAMGWNGLFFAELARRCEPSELAIVAGATQFFTFGGSMAGPVVLGEMLRHGTSYGGANLVLAVLPVVAGVSMAVSAGRS